MKRTHPSLEKIRQIFEKKNILFLLGVIGIVLIGFSEMVKPNEKPSPKTKSANESKPIQQMEQELEKRLEQLVREVEGAGEVKVMVTFENIGETVYALNEQRQNESLKEKQKQTNKTQVQTSHVFSNTGQKGEALVETQRLPQVQGVAVVAQGAANATVTRRVTELVSTVLQLPTNRVSVMPMNQK